jgi:hypothetical protein
VSEKQTDQDHEMPSAAPAKRSARFKVTKVETPTPPGGFVYARCSCGDYGPFFARTSVQVP